MKLSQIALTTGLLFYSAATGAADTLRLRDGSSLTGTFLGASTREVQFLPDGGAAKNIAISSVAGVDFEAPAPPPPPSAPAAAASTAGIVIPAGTEVTVRLIDGVDSTRTAAGERFRAGIDDPIILGDRVIIPRGADCTVQVIAVEENREMAIKLYDITLNGKAVSPSPRMASVIRLRLLPAI